MPLCNVQKVSSDLSECCENVENCIQVLLYVHKLIPNLLNKNIPIYNDFEKCIDLYKHILPSYNTFESELKVWIVKWKKVPQNECSKSAIDIWYFQ